MSRGHLFLLFVVVMCALGVVTSQHRARKAFVELEQAQTRQHQLEVEWGQLQLEQSTWAMHARVEKIATENLQMQLPDPAHTRVVYFGETPEVKP